jgi:hypothetical protein
MDPDPGGPKTCGSGSATLVSRDEFFLRILNINSVLFACALMVFTILAGLCKEAGRNFEIISRNGESIFDYEYRRKIKVKIAKASTVV